MKDSTFSQAHKPIQNYSDLERQYYRNWLMVRFSGTLERQYRDYRSEKDRRYILHFLSSLLVLYVGYGVWDWFLLSGEVSQSWSVRYLVGLPGLLVIRLFMSTAKGVQFQDRLVVLWIVWFSFVTLWMASIASDQVQLLYLVSEIVIIMIGLTATRLRFWHCLITGVAFIALHLLWFPPQGPEAMMRWYYLTLSMAAIAICIVAQYTVDRSARREYLQRILIDQQNQELKTLNKKLRGLADLDGLTGIANRRYFDQILNQEWRRARRRSYSLAVLMCDIDYFKAYNDHLGHQKGDQCIRAVAGCLRDRLRRPGDLVARYGGEEFAVILPSLDIGEAHNIAVELCESIEALNVAHPASGVSGYVTISIGVASCIPDENTTEIDLVGYADDALYQAKHQGRNRAVTFQRLRD